MKQAKSAAFPIVVGLSAIVSLVAGLGLWSVGAEISGAIVASGTVEVESERQIVQHPDGGVVGEIRARDGDQVKVGDILVRLDDTFLKSELTIVEQQLGEIFARRARLIAERNGDGELQALEMPAFSMLNDASFKAQISGQQRLFEARRESYLQEHLQLAEQKVQIERQVQGAQAQIAAFERQLDLIKREATGVQALFSRGLVQVARLNELQREEARLDGEIGRLTSVAADARAQISSLEIEGLRLTNSRREDAIARLRDLEYSEIELIQRHISLSEQLARLDVRSPANGTVFGSRVVATNSVVQSAEPILYIVPGDQPLQVRVRVDPTDIEQVFTNQPVSLMLTTFNRRTTPQIPGEVIRVSADAKIDESTGGRFYEAVIEPDAEVLHRLSDVALRPGMPVEAFLKTGQRTPLSYLMQPLTIYFERAFREE